MLGVAIADETELDTLLSEPSRRVVEMMSRLDGDIVVLGVGGKMGPTLARMAKRASDLAGRPRAVIGVSRFGSGRPGARASQAHGIETIRCDLLDDDAVAALPDAPERRLHGRAEVRLDRRRVADLGDELSSAGRRLPPLRRPAGSSRSRPATSMA